MKKLLALVLALVMTLGLATVGANAAYADADDIEYKEAVDVMTAIGVLAGDETGFRPADTLKRSEGAKIVAYLLLGNTTAESIQGTGTKFTDVPANHWAAGYIEYLTSAGVIGGVGANKFDPDGTLTATAFAKMLLCALNYDASIEGLVGDDWSINTQKLANQLSLFKGNSDVVGSAAVTREEAALYAFNTLRTPLVEYSTKGTNINVGETTVTVGASSAKPLTNNAATGQTISYRRVNSTDNANSGAFLVEFAEEKYSKLVLARNGEDEFGRPADIWTYEGKAVGTYTAEADLHYTESVTSAKIYADLGLTSTIPAPVYEDGVLRTTAGRNQVVALEKGNVNDLNKVGGQGADTYVYYDWDDDGNAYVDIYTINTWVGEVTSKTAATASKDAFITVSPLTESICDPANLAGHNNFTTDDEYAIEDIVLYTFSQKTGDVGIQSVKKAESVTGTMTKYTDATSATVGGETYKYAAKIALVAKAAFVNTGVEATIVLDNYGNAIAITDKGVVNYAVVLNATTVGGTYHTSNLARLLLSDGTTADVTVTNGDGAAAGDNTFADKDTTAAAATDIGTNDIVSYTVSNNKYTLTKLADGAASNIVVTNGNYSVAATSNATNPVTANGKTIFLVRSGTADNPVFTAYEGIKNVPSISAAAAAVTNAVYCKTAGVATVIYIDAINATIDESNTIFVKGHVTGRETHDASANYYTYDAIVDGEITKLSVSANLDGSNVMAGSVSYSTYTDGTKVATLGKIVRLPGNSNVANNSGLTVALGTRRMTASGVVGFGTSDSAAVWFVPASDCKVFYVNMDNELISGSLGAIENDTNDVAYFKLSNGALSYIVIDQYSAAGLKNNGLGTTYTAAAGTTGAITAGTVVTTADGYGTVYVYRGNAASTVTLSNADMLEQVADIIEADGGTVNSINNTTGVINYTMDGRTYNVAPTQTRVYKVTVNSTEYYVPATAPAATGRATINSAAGITLPTAFLMVADTTNAATNVAGGAEFVMPQDNITISYDTTATSSTTVALNTALANNDSITESSARDLDADLIVPADTTYQITGGLTNTNSKNITVSGTMTVTGSGEDLGTGTITVENGGTLTINDATVDVDSITFKVKAGGKLIINGAVTIGTDTLTVDAGAEAEIVGAVTVTGTITNNGTLKITGAVGDSAGKTITNTGTMEIVGAVTLNHANSRLDNSGTLSITGAVNLTNSVVTNSGTLRIIGSNKLTLTNGSVTNTGTLIAGGEVQVAADKVFTNSGTMNITGNFDIDATTAGKVSNSGTLTVGGNLLLDTGANTFKTTTDVTVDGALTLNGSAALDVGENATITVNGTVTGTYAQLAREVTITGTASDQTVTAPQPKVLIKTGSSAIDTAGTFAQGSNPATDKTSAHLIYLSDLAYGTSGSQYGAMYKFATTSATTGYYSGVKTVIQGTAQWVAASSTDIMFFATEKTGTVKLYFNPAGETQPGATIVEDDALPYHTSEGGTGTTSRDYTIITVNFLH